MTSSEVAVYPAAETALKNDLIDSTLITDLTTKTLEDEAKSTNDDEQIETDEPTTVTETTVTVHKQPVSNVKIKPLKISIPRISSRDLVRAHRPHSPASVKELEQMAELMLSGPGARREVNKQTVKLKNPELEECVKRAKKYAMEQSVRFVLVKQQQQQQKQQLDLIKKQQALLLMCR